MRERQQGIDSKLLFGQASPVYVFQSRSSHPRKVLFSLSYRMSNWIFASSNASCNSSKIINVMAFVKLYNNVKMKGTEKINPPFGGEDLH